MTVYLRNRDIDNYLAETAGVNRIVHGTFDETEKLAALAKEHDIVINVGSSWDPVPSRAIIAGLNERPAGTKSTLIHMSGAGKFVDTESDNGIANPNCKVWNVSQRPELLRIHCLICAGRQCRRYEVTKSKNAEWCS